MDTIDFVCYKDGGVGNTLEIIKLPASCCGVPTKIRMPPDIANGVSKFHQD